MAGFSGLLGDSDAVKQIFLWSVLNQVVQALMAPVTQAVANEVWKLDPDVPQSPAELADAVVRGVIDRDTGAGIAANSGMGGDTFDRLVAITGEPPALQELLLLFRRGQIDQDRLVHGIRQSRVKDEWIDAIEALQTAPLSAADAVAAAVENQLPHDVAQRKAFEDGTSAEDFAILVNTRGRPPGPAELLELVRRGIIPAEGKGPGVLSLDQGISESDVKDKWIPAYHQLLTYVPPPRTVTALLRAGSITTDQASKLFQQAGLSTEMATAYVADATHQKLAPHRELARTTVLSLYTAQVIDAATAQTLLADLGDTPEEVTWLLRLQDLQRALKALNTAIAHVHSQYIGRRLARSAAVTALDDLRVPADQRDQLLADWDLERAATVRVPSTATVAAALHWGIIDQPTAQSELEAQGYSAFDAWLELSVHEKTALPNQPASSWPEPNS